MFRSARKSGGTPTCFPRIRGDVPKHSGWGHDYFVFSPHTRGCSGGIGCDHRRDQVFPAYAGMFRKAQQKLGPEVRFPRIRGDVPALARSSHHSGAFPRIRGDVPPVMIAQMRINEFSPHTRGCSSLASWICRSIMVFPAYAGMFQGAVIHRTNINSFPRIHGDVPPG